LAGVYRELADHHPFSEVARVELSAAAAWSRVERLLICQCDTDGLELVSYFRRWWIADGAGLHADAEWPLSREVVRHEGWEAKTPFIKFAMDGCWVQFGMRFGPRWYVVRKGPLGDDGRFVPEQLAEEFRYVE
jgi:hypothetical protein